MNNIETESKANTASIFWITIGVAGLVFGVVAFFIKTLLTYIRLQVHPQNPIFSVYLILGIIVLAWFIKACGGGFASWYYKRSSGSAAIMGRAAMMGFLTGIVITIVSIILGAIWHWLAPGMIQQKLHTDIAIIKSLDLPADEKKLFIDSLKTNLTNFQNPGKLLFSGIFTYGIPNLITGMIGAKIFSRNDNKQAEDQNLRGN